MRDVVIACMTRSGKFLDRGIRFLAEKATREALEDENGGGFLGTDTAAVAVHILVK